MADQRIRKLLREAVESGDEEAIKQAALALCRSGEHIQCSIFVGKILDDGSHGAYCARPIGRYGCPVCMVCNQVACDHAHLFDPRKQTCNLYWAKVNIELTLEEDER